MELSTFANWNQTPADWYSIMHLSAEGCRCIEDVGLDESECLSAGQSAEIDRVSKAYPYLSDDLFVHTHLDKCLR
jgi:hypothetical protein